MHPESTHIVLTGGNGPSPYPMAVSRSTDRGTNWARHSLSGSDRGSAWALAVAPSDPGVIYVGGYVTTDGATYKSTDYGASWSATDASPPDTVYGLAVDARDANTVFAATATGQFMTTDGGATWNSCGGTPDLQAVVCFPGCPDTVFVGGETGVHVSYDGGQTWESLNQGLEGRQVKCLAFSVTDEPDLLAGTVGGAVYGYSFPTGVRESRPRLRAIRVDVYPNPAGRIARVLLPAGSSAGTARLWDAAGRCVLTRRVEGAGLDLDLASVQPGVYHLVLTHGEEKYRSRLIVAR
ncbi:MAG: T9SS type A sorting domain-containing protein [candidate division WOR-3 bacterium]|nr:MAG: T9SS type A sorting domain-containing protein [candidate division WOR-3 bacterium]